uniref:Uncharacterized protein n=1 Tax=viral metagenome TaxID=1070528 RepID=A0A6C0LEW4_9ZZZZ
MYPENHGKKWDTEETNKLMKEIKILNIKEIAKIHKRTDNAIFLKLIREAAKIAEADKNLNIYDLSIITTLKVRTIINGLKKINYNRFQFEDKNEEEKEEFTDKNEEKRITCFKFITVCIIGFTMLPILFQMG